MDMSESRWQHKLNILKKYADLSTIAGISQIKNVKSINGKLYWSLSLLTLVSLGTYWSLEIYTDWQNFPVLTAVKSTSFPLKNLPFPTVVVCSESFSLIQYLSSIIEKAEEVLKKIDGPNLGYSPYQVAREPMMLLKGSLYRNNFSGRINLTSFINTFMETPSPFLIYLHNDSDIFEFLLNFIYVYMPDWVTLWRAWGLSSSVMPQFKSRISNIIAHGNQSIVLSSYFNKEIKEYYESLRPSLISNVDRMHYWYTGNNTAKSAKILARFFWHATIPCYDVVNLTAEHNTGGAFLRNCKWKSKSLNCNTIFKAVLTNKELCCSFSLFNAEEQFSFLSYSEMIKQFQAKDKNNSFENSTLPFYYTHSHEPKSKTGAQMGLSLTLDGHSNLKSISSVKYNFDSFTVKVSSDTDFAEMTQGSFKVKSGVRSQLILKGIVINADKNLRTIPVQKRLCYFPEDFRLDLFKRYSQSQCIFECYLKIVKKHLESQNITFCLPWYYPFRVGIDAPCTLQTTFLVESSLGKGVKKTDCQYCQPDCSGIYYSHTLTSEPIRECDDLNIGRMTSSCSLTNFEPFEELNILVDQVRSQLNKTGKISKLLEEIPSRFRKTRIIDYTENFILESTGIPYDVYRKDVAMLSIYFEDLSAWEFLLFPKSSTVLFLSNIGGIFGLCFGFSLITIFELAWLTYNLLW